MKKYLSFILISIGINLIAQNNYQNGFNKGFQEGYCYGTIAGCISPIAPIAPLDINNDYKTGYNNGFVAGKKEKDNSQSNQSTGGWRGQIKPRNQGPAITETQIQSMNSAWEGYYEKRAAKKEQKREAENKNKATMYELTTDVIDLISRLSLKMQKSNTDQKLMDDTINNLHFDNQTIWNKYKDSPKKINNFITENYELRKRITSYIEGAKL